MANPAQRCPTGLQYAVQAWRLESLSRAPAAPGPEPPIPPQLPACLRTVRPLQLQGQRTMSACLGMAWWGVMPQVAPGERASQHCLRGMCLICICAGDEEVGQKKKSDPVNAEINGREVDFKNISTEEALQILEVQHVSLRPCDLIASVSACISLCTGPKAFIACMCPFLLFARQQASTHADQQLFH